MGRTCKSCGKEMFKESSINSGNSTFETWRCKECNEKEEFCTGLN